MAHSINKNKIIFYLGYIVAFITLLSLILLSRATEGSKEFEAIYTILLFVIIIGIGFLFIIVCYYLIQTFKVYRKKIPGAKLSLNILLRTFLLAFIPLLLISFFAFKFLRYEFKLSFDEGINDALNNALVLSKKALDVRALQALKESQAIAKGIANYEYITLQRRLEKIRKNVGANELTVFDEKGFIQAFSSENTNVIVPSFPDYNDFNRAKIEDGLFTIESEKEQFQIRVLTRVIKPGAPNYYLQSLFYIPNTVSELTNQVNRTITERDRLNYLMPKVSNSFIFVLILVLLLCSLLLILSSIGFSNYMVQPIKDLISGTKNVSQGDFNQHVIVKRKDDFGTLINSFNQMTTSLKDATIEAEINRAKVESERAYLETIINNMTSGVITLDYKNRLLTYNEIAEQLLDCSLKNIVFNDIELLDSEFDHYKDFIAQLNINNYQGDSAEIEIKLIKENKEKDFIAKLTSLPSNEKVHGGYVIIFNDLSDYWKKQKQAAWEEVARRLAHEIKNPLTPILLAAERLNYKLADSLKDKDKEILTTSIKVISNQVNALKDMVNDFSDYAKPINTEKSNINVSNLIKEIFYLYQENFNKIEFYLQLESSENTLYANAQLIRQVLHNLIKNAIEAVEDNDVGEIIISSKNKDDNLIITVSDNGVGISDNNENIFDPYITTKEKGTGLGLSIVKKIVQEHNGSIELLANSNASGTIAKMVFPLSKWC